MKTRFIAILVVESGISLDCFVNLVSLGRSELESGMEHPAWLVKKPCFTSRREIAPIYKLDHPCEKKCFRFAI